jgi:choline-sulfatase
MFRKLIVLLSWAALTLGLGSTPSWAASKPNIVLITLSSVRADRAGFLGASKSFTPNLDSLAHQSLIFQKAYAQAPLTVVSHATILSGTYPQTHGMTQFGSTFPPTLPFLPDILHSHGYRTAAFVGSIELDPHRGLAPGFDRGFRTYGAEFRRPRKGLNRYASAERRGIQVVASALAWVSQNSNAPFFLWVQLDDADALPASAYDEGVAAADSAAGKLLANLRARSLYDSALIVVVSDHGESLGAHGEKTHGIFLYDETLHVPLLIKLPANKSTGPVQAKVRLVDVAPSILEAAQLAVPPQMQGQSLLRIAKQGGEQPVYSRTDFPHRGFGWSALESWRAGKYLYVRAPKPELYDLSADPGATHNLAQSSKATLDTMASQLTSFGQRLAGQGGTAGTGLSSSEIQKLASLGYVGLQKSASGASSASTGTDPKDKVSDANAVLDALALIADGKPESAASPLHALADSGPKMYLAQYAMGLALAQQDQCPKAIEYLHNAVELQPDSAWAHYEMGSCLVKTGDYKSAIVHLEIATKRLPGFTDAQSLLTQAQSHSGKSKRNSLPPSSKQ